MAVFVRPVTWTYDLPLFRSTTDDEDHLEAMLAAVAREDEQLLVAESDNRPVAFAWLRLENDSLRMIQLHTATGQPAVELLRPLVARIEQDHAGRRPQLIVPARSIRGPDAEALRSVGFRYHGRVWTLQLDERNGPSPFVGSL